MRAATLTCVLMLIVASCGSPPTRRSKTLYADPAPAAITDARWLVRRAVCVDDGREIAGLTGTLHVHQAATEAPLSLSLELRADGCTWTSRYVATRRAAGCDADGCDVELVERWRAATGASTCSATPNGTVQTELRRDERELSFALRSGALCRDRDVRLQFESFGPALPPNDDTLARMAVASVRVGDGEGLAPLLSDDAILRTPSATGELVEQARGRDAIVRWLEARSQSTPRRALRFTSLAGDGSGAITARWESPDGEPAHGISRVALREGRVTAIDEQPSVAP